jgi:hypothetical protein
LAHERGYQPTHDPKQIPITFARISGRKAGHPASSRTAPSEATRAQRWQYQRLISSLQRGEYVWSNPSIVGLSLDGLLAVSRQFGALPLRQYGHQSDPVILLGKPMTGNVRDVIVRVGSPGRARSRFLLCILLLSPAAIFAIYLALAHSSLGGLHEGLSLLLVSPLIALIVFMTQRPLIRDYSQRVSDYANVLATSSGAVAVFVIGSRAEKVAIGDLAVDLGLAFSSSRKFFSTPLLFGEGKAATPALLSDLVRRYRPYTRPCTNPSRRHSRSPRPVDASRPRSAPIPDHPSRMGVHPPERAVRLLRRSDYGT